jgi:sec-independent protein translocase protein TatC
VSSQEQTLVDHLAELRTRLIRTLLFFVLALVVTFLFVDKIYHVLVNDATRMFPELGEIRLAVLGPGEILKVYFTVAGLAALFLTMPVLLYQAYAFVKPALEEQEAKVLFRYLPAIVLVFVTGIAFGYFFVFPLLFKFLWDIGQQQFEITFTAMNYFSFMSSMVVPFGFIFEMPIAVMFLTRLGLITPQLLTKVRKYAYFVIVVIASMISPPEFFSHIAVAAPMILLYELSISVSRWAAKRREQMLLAQEAMYADERDE